jgi:predicted peroxiredoxin
MLRSIWRPWRLSLPFFADTGSVERRWSKEGGLMKRILFNVTNGSNDPTKATLPFIGAVSAIDNGDRPEVALLGEGAYLAVPEVASAVHGIGFPPLSDLLVRIVEHEVPVYV